jgi:hypothetical protein
MCAVDTHRFCSALHMILNGVWRVLSANDCFTLCGFTIYRFDIIFYFYFPIFSFFIFSIVGRKAN